MEGGAFAMARIKIQAVLTSEVCLRRNTECLFLVFILKFCHHVADSTIGDFMYLFMTIFQQTAIKKGRRFLFKPKSTIWWSDGLAVILVLTNNIILE